MCSICGGTNLNDVAFHIFKRAQDRGRDYSNLFFRKGSWICNHRAVPTTELENSDYNQPFGTDYKVVHNGTISNDKELGNKGNIDSAILPKVLDFTSLEDFTESLQCIVGSYAIAVLKPNGHFYLACNYKPIFYSFTPDGDFYFSSYAHHLEGLPNVTKMPPYSTFDTETKETGIIPRKVYDRAVVICSGGLDSTAVASYVRQNHKDMILLHFQYGCLAETKETQCIKQLAEDFHCDYKFMPLNYDFSNCHLLGNGDDIAEGEAGAEYAHEWVPARNLVLMSMAVAFAEANHYSYIYLGTNLEEGGAYPDNEEQFIRDFNSCLYGAVQNGNYVEIRTPVGNLMKHEIVAFGNKYGAPFEHTWSCYRNGDKPCGHCGPCHMRKIAFERNGLVDPLLKEE